MHYMHYKHYKHYKHCIHIQGLLLAKVEAGKMLIELDSDLKPDVAKIMEEIIDSNDHLSMVSRQYKYNIANINITSPI
jgi:L-fucose mutarotase/ribose pyranase (RbsD/FucU family)